MNSYEMNLIDSIHFKSILKEQKVFNIVKKIIKDTQMGAFYTDPESSKSREIDILAQFTKVKEIRGHEITIKTIFPIECKTIEEYSIILYNQIQTGTKQMPNHAWPLEFLQADIFKKIRREAYHLSAKKRFDLEHPNAQPDLSAQIDIAAELTPFIFPLFSSFREMKPGSVKKKEEKASVVWDASQGLRSCQLYFINEVMRLTVEQAMEELATFIDEVEQSRDATHSTIPLTALKSIKALKNSFYSIHPILVVDASLYALDEAGALMPIPAANLAFFGVNSILNFQMTLMSYDTFETQIQAMFDSILT